MISLMRFQFPVNARRNDGRERMNALIKVNFKSEQPTISARELHDGLEAQKKEIYQDCKKKREVN